MAKGTCWATIRKNGSSSVVTVSPLLKRGFKLGDVVKVTIETVEIDELVTKKLG